LIDSKSEWFNETNVVFQQVLDQVASNLNEIHSVNHSTKYWNILVGPWLQRFVDMVTFRMYEIGQNANVQNVTLKSLPANSLLEFAERAKTSIFVESLHADVLTQLNTTAESTTHRNGARTKALNQSFKAKLGKTYVSATYLPRIIEVLLQLGLGRLPQKLNFIQVPNSTINFQLRELLSKSSGSITKGTEIALALLPMHMPCAYVEGFKSLFETSKPWKSKRFPSVIFTANRHLYDDVFNFWTALAVESGSHLVLAQHGGNYGISEFPSFAERHENLVADRYITWGWSSTGPTYKGFALPLIGRALHSSQPNGPLLVITDQLWKYPRSIFSDTPESSTYLDHLKSTIDGLLPEIRSEALLRIHHAHGDAGSSQINWWKLNNPDIRQDVGDIGFQKRLAQSRLVLIAHNGTSIPESIALHAPTIITWSDSYMKVRQSAEPVFDALEQVGIFHRTPESAAAFINSIWDDVDGWWNSQPTLDARKQFTDQYARTVSNPVRFLAKALRF
jgi:putative transferase (TIGR04331 family)